MVDLDAEITRLWILSGKQYERYLKTIKLLRNAEMKREIDK